MSRHPVAAKKITRINGVQRQATEDLLAVEEPLEIRLSYGSDENRTQKQLAVTMRTPGNDFELTAGFLFTEGIISSYKDITHIRYCTEPKDAAEEGNVVLVYLHPEVAFDARKTDRHFYTTSSCGVCGKSSIEAIHNQGCSFLPDDGFRISPEMVHQLSKTLAEDQTVFKHTGGIHAAALFDRDGRLLLVREDIGRHNAVDKLIGAALAQNQVPLKEQVMLVSGRAGFELVQKAIVAGIPAMAAVGAPSSLAVNLAQAFNLTLLGFVRNNRFNIYSGAERIF